MNGLAFKRLFGMILVGVAMAIGPVACNKGPDAGGKKDVAKAEGQKKDVPPAAKRPQVPVAELKLEAGKPIPLPFIFWGGDAATFHANGGVETKAGSIFDSMGLKFKLERGDNWDDQIKSYKEGTTPFLRGVMSQFGQASEELGADPRTRPVVFLQLTWSAGDHLVARGNIRLLDDLRGKTIAIMEGGPHVGMLHDVLKTARLNRNDVKIVWTKDPVGPDGPVELYKKDPKIDACFAISPEMTDVTGGLEKRGKDGSHVLVSTAHMSRSIADVYACRKDYYDRNKDAVDKLTAGYLKGVEELLAAKREKGARYKAILKMTQDIFGKDVPSEDDAIGLIDDATFVGVQGNNRFFNDAGNLSGFEAKRRASLDAALAEGAIKQASNFAGVTFDLAGIKKLGDLKAPELPAERFPKNLKSLPSETIFSFNISFDPDQSEFPVERYGDDFQRALEMASIFGKAGIQVRGHADPTNLLGEFVDAGIAMNVLRSNPNNSYSLVKTGANLDIGNLKLVRETIEKEKMPTKLRDYLQGLSERRADKVQGTILEFAGKKRLIFDKSQIVSQGAGAFEPVVASLRPTDEQSRMNRRVEFRIVRFKSGDIGPANPEIDIDY